MAFRWRNLTKDYEASNDQQRKEEEDDEDERVRERKEEVTRKLYKVAGRGGGSRNHRYQNTEEKKVIGTRFWNPKDKKVVDTRRAFEEKESEEYEEEYEYEIEEPTTVRRKTTHKKPPQRQRVKQRSKPKEKVYYEEEKIGEEKKNLRFEIDNKDAKQRSKAQSEEWGKKMWDEIKADDKFGWGKETARDKKRRLGMKRRRVAEAVEEQEEGGGLEVAGLWADQQVAGSSVSQDRWASYQCCSAGIRPVPACNLPIETLTEY